MLKTKLTVVLYEAGVKLISVGLIPGDVLEDCGGDFCDEVFCGFKGFSAVGDKDGNGVSIAAVQEYEAYVIDPVVPSVRGLVTGAGFVSDRCASTFEGVGEPARTGIAPEHGFFHITEIFPAEGFACDEQFR